jgi:hypothetical protein
MARQKALQVVLVVVGLLFFGGSAFGLTVLNTSPFEQMMASVYATLGAFLLLAVRSPSANRSLIAFTAWSSFAHGAVMAVQAFKNLIPRADLYRAVLPLVVIGVLLIALAPAKPSAARASAVAA